MRAQTQYLFSIGKALGLEGKSPEETLREIENPTPVKTAEEIEEEVFKKFEELKKG